LNEAQEKLATTNGSYQPWLDAKNRVDFAAREVDRKRAAVEQCRQNISCAETALATAQRETRVEELKQSVGQNRTRAQQLAAQAASLHAELTLALVGLDQCSAESKQLVHELSSLNNTHEASLDVVALLLCERVRNNEGFVAAVVTQAGGWDGNEVSRAQKNGLSDCSLNLNTLLALQPAGNPRNRLEQLARLGDADALAELRPLHATEQVAAEYRRAQFKEAVSRRGSTLIEAGPKMQSLPSRTTYP
jgi:hypothetical protein